MRSRLYLNLAKGYAHLVCERFSVHTEQRCGLTQDLHVLTIPSLKRPSTAVDLVVQPRVSSPRNGYVLQSDYSRRLLASPRTGEYYLVQWWGYVATPY